MTPVYSFFNTLLIRNGQIIRDEGLPLCFCYPFHIRLCTRESISPLSDELQRRTGRELLI
jgi:hypothetical protein